MPRPRQRRDDNYVPDPLQMLGTVRRVREIAVASRHTNKNEMAVHAPVATRSKCSMLISLHESSAEKLRNDE